MNYTITVDCDSGNDYDGRIGVRVSSIFVIGFGSMLGALLPIALARSKKMQVPPLIFFMIKYFGSGVIIATAFIHLLSPANAALNSPCNTGPITTYDWAQGICLMTIFVMFLVELMVARFDLLGKNPNDLEASDPSKNLLETTEKHCQQNHSIRETDDHGVPRSNENSTGDAHGPLRSNGSPSSSSSTVAQVPKTRSSIPGKPNDLSYPPGGEDHLGHQRDHDKFDADKFAAQMTAIFILEFGVIFHSIFIGLTLAVTGENFNILYIVLTFHQTFEGLGLGSRLATAQWPKKKLWMPWLLGGIYGLTTPIAIAIGLGVREKLDPNSQSTRIVNGVFDSVSAGVLIYTGLVELMAHEFMFNEEMRKSSIKMMLFAFLCMSVGATIMAVLGKWA